jgi:hypothetical protein
MSKLNMPQEQVIMAMQKGWYLRRAAHYLKCTLSKADSFKPIQYSTINALLAKKLITFKRVKEDTIEYFLTDLGNDIKL